MLSLSILFCSPNAAFAAPMGPPRSSWLRGESGGSCRLISRAIVIATCLPNARAKTKLILELTIIDIQIDFNCRKNKFSVNSYIVPKKIQALRIFTKSYPQSFAKIAIFTQKVNFLVKEFACLIFLLYLCRLIVLIQ